jgi:hypothetical protein
VHVAVHETGDEDAAGKVADLAALVGQADAHLGDGTIVGNLEVGHLVEAKLRVDEPRVLKQ